MRNHKAVETKSADEALRDLDTVRKHTAAKFRRLRSIANIPEGARVLDIGAAHGLFVSACMELGYRCVGVEPWDKARTVAGEVGKRLGAEIDIREGMAEKLPFEDESFHVVHANSVIEHVADLDESLREINRVLKPGGLFWFNAASSMCPRQSEIGGFPLFGWYPNVVKLKIMNWAVENKPRLIGHTRMPAINWFTPWKARRVLKRHGFPKVYDRWELRRHEESGVAYRTIITILKKAPPLRILVDIAKSGCSYAAVK